MKTIICLLFVLTSISSYAQKVIQKTDERQTSVHRINLVRVFNFNVYPNGDTIHPSGRENTDYMYLIDADTKKKISANYSSIDPVTNKEFIATRKDDLGYNDSTFRHVTGVINPEGEEVVPFIFDAIDAKISPQDPTLLVYCGSINGRIVFINKRTFTVTPFEVEAGSYSSLIAFSPFGYSVVTIGKKQGITKDGKLFVPAHYDRVFPSFGKAQIATYIMVNRVGYISLNTGKILTPPIFDLDGFNEFTLVESSLKFIFAIPCQWFCGNPEALCKSLFRIENVPVFLFDRPKDGVFFTQFSQIYTKETSARKKVRIKIDGKSGWVDNTGKVTMDK